jgi:hypothetical protein
MADLERMVKEQSELDKVSGHHPRPPLTRSQAVAAKHAYLTREKSAHIEKVAAKVHEIIDE